MRRTPSGYGILAACLALTAALLATPTSALAQTLTLQSTNLTWRLFKGTSEPPASWRDPGFSDSGWLPAPAPVWFGEPALFGGTGTELTDMQNRYSTVYLRSRFSVAAPEFFESLQLNVRCDDGFVAWLNGRRVAAASAPAGNPPFNAVATANALEPVQRIPYLLPDAASALVPGDNVLAIQVLNNSLGSSDIVLVADLVGTLRPSIPPSVLSVAPSPGPVTALDRITVTFTEPVQGVRAEDFLVNGASATGVEGGGARWTFTFPQPPFGPVGISWAAAHTLTDLASPPVRFEVSAPGSIWGYELIDPNGPNVAEILPPPHREVSRLSQVSVTFDKAVTGVDASDLTRNGTPALRVSGFGAGPFLFEFPPADTGSARLAWIENHGIASDSVEPHAFRGGAWTQTVNPALTPPALVITELMAENLTAYRDEDADPEDWIEIWNPTASPVNLEGWSLSDERDEPGLWVFPATTLPAGGHLVVFASGKDRRPGTTGRLHTGFKLNPNGGTVSLYGPELPRQAVAEAAFPIQGPDHSWGRENNTGAWRYFKTGTPGARNGTSRIRSAVAPVQFSVPRGFFSSPFHLALRTATPGATIRYTTNGAPPTETTGFLYDAPIPIEVNRVLRAAAFAPDALPSRTETHTYLVAQTGTRLRLPALSLVTDTNHLYGRNGIMEVNPRNTNKRGPAWERPVSAEFIRVEDNGGFQTDCGLRIQGGDYVRGQYNYRSTSLPFSKYSFRLYFRGEYGQGRLEYPIFPDTTQASFDTLVLRAGMNDHSNPYLTDEFVRALARDCGQPSAAGTFVHLFLNGVYRGYYNPCERVDVDFLRAYHGGGETWDVMAQFGEVREGDATAFNAMRNLANTADLNDPVRYRDMAGRLDLTNFVDYLLPLIYVDNDDWPHNNWRAARERVPGGLYRFYVWDAEWACGIVNGHSVTWNTIQNQLSSTSPPWGGTDIQRLYLGLRKSAEFRLLFADRVHRHFFNGGALTDERLRARYAVITNRLNGVVAGFNNAIGNTWIPNRRRNVLLHLERAGLSASSNAPVFAQHGGRFTPGFPLAVTNVVGPIYYTTNGTDPRTPFSLQPSADARLLASPLVLNHPLTLRARSLQGTNWSALTEASFEPNPLAPTLRFTEIMYNPVGGEAFEFLEIANLGSLPVPVAGFSLTGVEFRFPEGTPPMPSGARWVLANRTRPTDFTARHPAATVAGWFDGSLANGGERIELLDRSGRVVDAVDYQDSPPWPAAADGSGPSLELAHPDLDPSSPAAWISRPGTVGTPGLPPAAEPPRTVVLSEVFASDTPTSEADWIELANPGPTAVSLARWSLSDSSDPRRFVFPATASIAPGGFLRVWAAAIPAGTGLTIGFALSAAGDTLALYDASTNRIDVVRFGRVPSGYTLGRVDNGTAWVLTEPTPGAPNEPAVVAPPAAIAINEWVSHPAAGESDWIELHNTHGSLAAPLSGLSLTLSNALHRFAWPAFIPPSGFVVLQADAQPGPDHLGFKLPAAGDTLTLFGPDGAELQRVTYRSQPEGVALGRIPDGTGTPIALPGTASPGASNYVASGTGPRLNEFMARNLAAVVSPDGRFADWIELRNPATTAFDLSDAGLGLGAGDTPDWRFPRGTSIPAQGHLVIWCDGDLPPSTNLTARLNFGRNLPSEGGRLTLFNAAGQVLDTLTYGAQLANRACGRITNANGQPASWSLLITATPGAANSGPAALGNPANTRLNEWQVLDAPADQEPNWFELFNPEALPVDLGGHLLTDDPSRAGITNHVVAPLTLIGPSEHIVFLADGGRAGAPDHVGFRLGGWGETLRLYSPSGGLIDSVSTLPTPPGVAEGRLPDGADSILRLSGTASPGRANWIQHPDLVIHEVLAHTDPPFEDAVELRNRTDDSLDLGGWYLSNDVDDLRRIPIPAGTQVPANAYHVLYERLFNPAGQSAAFTINSARGDDVWLSETDRAGRLTGRRAFAHIGPSANAESWGWHRTSVGEDFVPLSRPTFGKDTPRSVEEFRMGTGLPNAYPRVGPVVISEIHYRPPAGDTAGTEAADLEFLELHNPTSSTVPLYLPSTPILTWRLRGGVEFDFPPGVTLPPGGRLVVTRFAPTNSAALTAFARALALPAGTPVHGPFSGRLGNEGDEIRLERPDEPQAPPHPDAGLVPWLLVERVRYQPSFPWPVVVSAAQPPGLSLHRRRTSEFADDPAHWIAAAPNPGAATVTPSGDRDLDGLPNDWETRYALNPDDPADAGLDADLDGQSNLAEFIAGTNPRSATSVLALQLIRDASLGTVLAFRAAADRTYTLLEQDGLGTGEWKPFAHIGAESPDRDVVVPLGPYHSRPRFFRVVTPRIADP